jgi:hypothetical protein
MARTRSTTQLERGIRTRDTLGVVMNDLVSAVMGGLAGGTACLMAGPQAMIVGASMGAVAGLALGHFSHREQQENDMHTRELDDIDRDYSDSMTTWPAMSARRF